MQLPYGIYAQITDKNFFAKETPEEIQDYEELKLGFKNAKFENKLHRIGEPWNSENIDYDAIILTYEIKKPEPGETAKYDIDANIPLFNIKNVASTILTEQNIKTKELFIDKITDIEENTTSHTIYSVNYEAYVNNNVLSVVIKCSFKDGPNPQRIILGTINYDIEHDKILSLEDLINKKGLKTEEVQKKINKEIQASAKLQETMGTVIYRIDPNNEMYVVQNTEEFFLGDKNNLYIIYPYGNNQFTNQMDVVIF